MCHASAADALEHWAYQPLAATKPPAVEASQWPATDIDRFILARLEAAGLSPSTPADPLLQLRRITFDLAGRPPTLAEQDAYLAGDRATRWSETVDRLLASPQFGERWAQHWLDVARFAESSGGGRSLMYPEAWRYRDWVIDALNDDLPFDEFVMQQLAGDLLPADSSAQRDRQLIATGFLTLGAINYEAQDKQLLEMEIVDEQIEAVGRAFLGLSLGCARCHDHKFDPIATEEYYGLAGIFASTQSVVHENVGRPMTMPLESTDAVAKFRKYQQQVEAAKARIQELEAEASSAVGEEKASLVAELEAAQQKAADLAKNAPRQPIAMGVCDAPEPGDTHVRYGGDVHHRGPLAPRTFISIAGLPDELRGEDGLPRIPNDASGRLELSRWIASPENRLTARVLVNRVWGRLLGEGLVASPDDFGVTGSAPTHPELLDYLARTFIDEGWSVKQLVRRIALSNVYRQSSTPTPVQRAADPANRLLARARTRVLDAESLRDALLQISGMLDSTRGGPTIQKISKYDTGYDFTSRRRSIYVPRFRNVQPEIMQAFGTANANMVSGKRTASILPRQALYLLNGPLVIDAAEQTAKRLLIETPDAETRIEQLLRLAWGRRPTEPERQLARDYLSDMAETSEVSEASNAAERQAAWSGLAQLAFGAVEFRFLQ